jgi:phospholipid/cholesterol/gamma-HCH transport system substrate-binding protein
MPVTKPHPHGRRARRAESKRRDRFAALAAIGIFALGTLYVFDHRVLFGGGFTLRATFAQTSQVKDGSEVRTAGIQIGQVTSVEVGPGDASTVTMQVDPSGLPVHADATVTVKPRLVLEGNGYIDLNPGTPDAPVLRSGATLPRAQTTVTVQLDQVLDTFTLPVRGALQQSVAGLAQGLGGSGAGAMRASIAALDSSAVDLGQVAHAAQGTAPFDLPRTVSSSASLLDQLSQNPQALADSVTSFDRTMAAIAANDQALAGTVEAGDRLLLLAPPTLAKLDAALPPLKTFATALTPALRAAPPTLERTTRLLQQISAVVSRPQLPTLLDELTPVVTQLPTLEGRLQNLFSYTTPVTDCITTHVVPVLDMKIQDGPNTTGDPVWLDLMHTFAGFTSASTSYDGNGGTFRAGLAQGSNVVQALLPGLGKFVGQLDPNATEVRPAWLGYGVEPPFRPDVPCASQQLPMLNVPAAPSPSWDEQLLPSPSKRDMSAAFDSLAEMGFGALTGHPATVRQPPRSGATHALGAGATTPSQPASPASASSLPSTLAKGVSGAVGTLAGTVSTAVHAAAPVTAPLSKLGATLAQKLGSLLGPRK